MKHYTFPIMTVTLGALFLSACTTLPPSGPNVMVLPGTGKSFDQFRDDDIGCRQFAMQQVGITPDNAAVDSGVRSAALGTLLGAVAGAAFNGGRGAAVGAGAGLLLGGSAGAGAASQSAYGAQRRYDNGYTQCMYAKGNRVPVSGRMMSDSASRNSYAPPVSGNYAPSPAQGPTRMPPPPPEGMPPPPPPG